MFETRLKEYNPGATSITYDYNSLCQYLDDMVSVTSTVRKQHTLYALRHS